MLGIKLQSKWYHSGFQISLGMGGQYLPNHLSVQEDQNVCVDLVGSILVWWAQLLSRREFQPEILVSINTPSGTFSVVNPNLQTRSTEPQTALSALSLNY